MSLPASPQSSLTVQLRAFRLAESLLDFESCAVTNWCDCYEVDPNAWSLPVHDVTPEFLDARFGEAETLIKWLAAGLKRDRRDTLRSNALTAMRTALERFHQEFQGDCRREKVETVVRAKPESVADVRAFMFDKSPFSSPDWTQMWVKVRQFIAVLPAGAACCFRIAEIVHRERWQTVSREQAARLGIRHERFLTTYFALRLRRTVRNLIAEIPALSGLRCDVTYETFFADESDDARGGYVLWVKKKLGHFRDQTESRLREASDDLVDVLEQKPKWDTEAGTLWYEGRPILKLRANAKNVRRILTVFEEDCWDSKIYNPWPPEKDRNPENHVHDAVRYLNERLKVSNPNGVPIRFHEMDAGEAIGWSREVSNRDHTGRS